MATYSKAWSSFNDGELSPLLDGRFDLPQYDRGGKTMLNFIPTVQGPMIRRGGTRLLLFSGYNNNPPLTIAFSRSRTESYLIEFGNFQATFFFNGAIVETGPNVPFVLTTPYAIADLYNSDGTPAISYAESIDQMYLSHPKYPPQILSFFGATNWTIVPLAYFDGPWQDGNADKTNTMQLFGGATVGSSVLVQATQSTFTSTDVGRLIRIHQQDLSQIKAWYPGQRTTGGNLAVGQRRRSGANTYQCKSVAPGSGSNIDWVETGSDTLITTDGDQWDGPQDVVPNPATANHNYGRGVQWTYEDCGYGVAVITQFIDQNNVIATVTRQFPISLTATVASWRWELGAWSNTTGWPRLVTFFKQRLVFAGIDRIWMSVSGDFANFADLQFGQVLTDSALTAQVLSDQLNAINWLSPQKTLLVGTTGGEFVISQQSISDPFGPTNFQIDPYSNYGGRQVNPIRVQTATIFAQQNGRSLREFSYVFTSDAYQSTDLNPLSEHICEGGIIGMAWGKFPYYLIWCVLGNGKICAFTYNPEQNVRAWHEHSLAGDADVKCVTALPSLDGSVDDVYMVVGRTPVGGVTTYSIEKLELPFDANAPGARQQDMFYVDAGLTVEDTIAAMLTPGTGADAKGTTGVVFTTDSGVFLSTDINRFIDYDFTIPAVNAKGLTIDTPVRARAQITQFNSSMQVIATIIAAWPNLDPIASNDWRMSVSTIPFPPALWESGTVSMLIDGAAAPDLDYQFGPITLPYPGSVVQIGLKSPAVWQSFTPEGGDETGPAMGKQRRIVEATIRVVDSLGVEIGPDIDNLQVLETRPIGWPDDNAPPLYSGNLPSPDPSTRIMFNGDWGTDSGVMIRVAQPVAATICAISALINEEP